MGNVYPSWRYHPVDDATIVKNQADEDARTPEADGWRHEPYSDEEKADLQGVDDVKEDGEPKKPLATDFNKKKDYLAAIKQYEADLAAYKKASK